VGDGEKFGRGHTQCILPGHPSPHEVDQVDLRTRASRAVRILAR
jgi:hypothetical protein